MPSGAPRPRLILASRSPRRRELLSSAGYPFEVRPAAETTECGLRPGEDAAQLVARLAYQKAADVASQISSGLILGCDTVVECDAQILGKPAGSDDARRMLQALSGRQHRVLTGLCLWQKPGAGPKVRVDVTTLRMDPLPDAEIDRYLAGGAWKGKAGAFGYQDRPGWIHIIQGSESNVVGLPLELLAEMLAEIPS